MPQWLEIALVVLTGLAFGSFVTLVSYRLPLELPVAGGRSQCPSCKTGLGPKALFPVFSWLWQRAKCRYCQRPISARYPATELAQALLFLLVYWTYGITWPGMIVAAFSVCMLVVIVVDLEWQIIPDEMQIAMLVLGVVYQAVIPNQPVVPHVLASMALGAVIGLSLRLGYGWLRKKEVLGWGDVKFLPIAGLWLGDLYIWPAYLFYAGMIGVMTAVAWRMMGKGARFPFGPALLVALLLCILTPAAGLFYWTAARLFA
ncbi:MAG: prepilin peptidase [Rickettsiales bacterium]